MAKEIAELTVPWRQESEVTWTARVMPNPIGLQLEVWFEGRWGWAVHLTTPDDTEKIAIGLADDLEDAKRRAKSAAFQILYVHLKDCQAALEMVSP